MQPRLTLLFAAAAGTAVADFWIGNCASTSNAASSDEIALPGSQIDCNYKAVPDATQICNATAEINTQNNGGVCPGNDESRSLSFCNLELAGSGCPSSFRINTRDDCGDAALKNNTLPANGFFYGDLIDTAQNNIAVGRCVYEADPDGQEKCTGGEAGEETVCQTFIRCYTGMYGSQAC
ncbi:hypothetical protein Slin14017_G037830 [Septoria linicola]|nr:hypothetical protein Slin14017_G037830 [Septoria linicola]